MSTISLQTPALIVPILSMNQWIEVNHDPKHMPHTSNSGMNERVGKHKFMDKEVCVF